MNFLNYDADRELLQRVLTYLYFRFLVHVHTDVRVYAICVTSRGLLKRV